MNKRLCTVEMMTDNDAQRRLLRGCDAAQQEAITIDASPVLVVAGAGSGKTRVLTNRIAWRALNGSASPAHVLALTFTRKAAGELRHRLSGLGLSQKVTAGTFHAVALAELRRHAADEGRAMPAVLDSKARLLQEIVPERAEPGLARFSRTEVLRVVAGEIEWARARCVAPQDYGFAATTARRNLDIDRSLIAKWYLEYEQQKKRRRLYDFDDLLERFASLIETNANFAAVERWRFRHLFVDELQDANPAQLRLLSALYGPDADLFTVGDARQAIYGWNGSDTTAVTAFAERFPGATVLELSTNYRSTPQVVAFASAILTGAPGFGPVRPDGPLPTITAYEDDTAEVLGTLEQIRHDRRCGKAWSDIAVLARTNAQLRLFETALSKSGVPTRGLSSLSTRSAAFQALARARDCPTFLSRLSDLEDALSDDEDESEDRDAMNERAELVSVVRLGREYAALDERPSGDGFFAYARSDVIESDADAVSLLSFHRAKGLEWKVVFVVGLEEGLVPISHASTRGAKDEERRLLYVALTRAEDELHCSYAKARKFADRLQSRSPSPYLETLLQALEELPRPVLPDNSVIKREIARSRAVLRGRNEVDR